MVAGGVTSLCQPVQTGDAAATAWGRPVEPPATNPPMARLPARREATMTDRTTRAAAEWPGVAGAAVTRARAPSAWERDYATVNGGWATVSDECGAAAPASAPPSRGCGSSAIRVVGDRNARSGDGAAARQQLRDE